MKIHANGTAIHVQVTGTGPTAVVFLHYWGGSSRTWRHVTRALPSSLESIAMDHRGWGESDPGQGDYSLEALAADAMAVIAQRKLTRYVLVGHSMGGKVAQLLASRRPAGLVGMVLVAPASPGASRVPAEQREAMTRAYETRESVTATCEHVLAGKSLSPDDLEQVVEDSLRGTREAKVAWPMRIMMEDIRTQVTNIHVPVLVIGGALDKVDPVDGLRSDVVAQIPGATLTVLEGTGHLSPLESPLELAGHIGRFVGSL